MRRRVCGVFVGLSVIVGACAPAGGSGSVAVDGSAGEQMVPVFEVVAVGDVPVGEMVAAGAAEAAAGGLVLVSASLDSLAVRWGDSLAPGATGFRLRWRPRRAEGENPWSVAELGAAAREYTVGGLEAGWRYRLRLAAVGGDDVSVEVAVADFFTLATPVRELSARAVAHDAVRLRWRSPEGWSPVGYVVQWRRGVPGPFTGRARAPPGAREHLITGLDGDRRYRFRVTALTARGWQSAPSAVRVRTRQAPESPLRLEVSVPAYCLADEGRVTGTDRSALGLEPTYERIEVPSVLLQWHLTGGTGPYTVSFPGGTYQGATSVADVSCATEGAEFSDPEASVVESGTKTFTVTATDAAGNTATRTVAIEIIEDIETAGSWHDGDTLQPGRIYNHGRLFIETPEGTRIGYSGVVEGQYTYDAFVAVTHRQRITELLVHSSTDEEAHQSISRSVYVLDEDGGEFPDFGAPLTDSENEMWDRFLANIRTSPFPAGDPRNEPPLPLSLSNSVGQSSPSALPMCVDRDNKQLTIAGDRWLPYGSLSANDLNLHGLPCEGKVAVHPSLLKGDPITVCIRGGVRDALLVPALVAATGDWNNLLAPDHQNPDPAMRRGLGYAPLYFDNTSPDCPVRLGASDTKYIQVFDLRLCAANIATSCGRTGGDAALATTNKSGGPPRVKRNILRILNASGRSHAVIQEELQRLLSHEIGHFFGLADYRYGCWRLVDGNGTVHPTIMSYGRDARGHPDGTADKANCFSRDITKRDLADLHAVYHPLAVTGLALREESQDRWMLEWQSPVGSPATYNAEWFGIARRLLQTRDAASGAPTGPSDWSLIGLQSPELVRFIIPISANVAGYEYAVVGLTRGDHHRGLSGDYGLGLRHQSLVRSVGSRPWTAGSANASVVAPPPVGAYNLSFPVASYGADGTGQWRFAFWGRNVSGFRPTHGGPVDIEPGDMIISYGQAYTSFAANPFDPSVFNPIDIRYGSTAITVTSCDTHFWNNGRYECQIEDVFDWVDGEHPLRVVVTTSATSSSTSPVAGTYDLQRDNYSVANFGEDASGEWRFAFWGRPLRGYRPQYGGSVTINPGDLVLSYGQPYTSFLASPFAADKFKPLRIRYGTTNFTVTSCDTHFWNNGRYECHVRGAVTWNASDIPADITVNRAIATAPNATSARTEPEIVRTFGDSYTTTPTFRPTCPTWDTQTCP